MIEKGVAIVALVTAAVLGLLIGILIGAGIAKAAPFTPELEVDYAYAERWWGAAPISCSSVTREVLPQAEFGGESTWGRATMPSGDRIVACDLRVAEEIPPCARREVVLHEYGHLLGYGHSEDPASVMYTEGNGACDRQWRAEQAAQLRRGLKKINARCRAKTTPLQRQLCRHTEHEYRRMLAAALDGV